jgi:hypothetical protein
MMYGTGHLETKQLGRNLDVRRENLSLRATIGNSHLLRRLDSGPDHPRLIILRKCLSVTEAISEMVKASADCALVQEGPETVEGIVFLKNLLELVGSGKLLVYPKICHVMERGIAMEPATATIQEMFNRALVSKTAFFTIVDSRGFLKGVVPVGDLLDFCLKERDSLELSADIEVESH